MSRFRRVRIPTVFIIILLGALPRAGAAQDGGGARASFRPAHPVQGSFIIVAVRVPASADSVRIAGDLAGQPLHFAREADGVYRTLAGVPIDAPDTLATRLVVERHAAPAETLDVRISVAKANYPIERLTVAPEFGREPDSLLAARIAGESRRALEVSRRSHDTPRLWKSPFLRPRPGRVTSGYGRGREYNGTVTGRHMGTDFAGAPGAPIRAMNRGIVALVDTFYLGGRVVYLDHGAGLVTAYLHLSRADVVVGDTVARGAVIGRVGSTGRVTGPHLHLVARYGTITLDPMSLLALLGAPPAKPRTAGQGAPARKTP